MKVMSCEEVYNMHEGDKYTNFGRNCL